MVVHVVALVTPTPGKEARVEELIKELTANVHKHEPDVEKYIAFKTKNADGGTEYVFQERYKDHKALEAHGGTEYFKVLGKTMAEEELLAKNLNIMVLEPLSGFESR